MVGGVGSRQNHVFEGLESEKNVVCLRKSKKVSMV